MNRIATMTLALGIALSAFGCGDGKGTLNQSKFDGRTMFNDEDGDYIEVENKSGYDLDDVNVDLTFIGPTGEKVPSKQSWAQWKNGEVKTVIARNSEGKPFKYLHGAIGKGSSTRFNITFGAFIKEEF